MFLSPPEIKQQQLREKKGAYERADVDALIDNVVGSYQHVWLERDRLKARVEELEREMANTKELEQLLRDGLASAQRAAEQVKQEAEAKISGLVEEAQAKADALLADARAQAEGIVADSRRERDRLDEETTRLQQANADVRERYRAFLLEALSVVEGTAEHQAVEAPEPTLADADESAPVPKADSDAVLEEAGWLATVPLVAVTADSLDENVAEQVSEAEAEAEPQTEPELEAETEPESEPEHEPEPELAASVEAGEEEDVPATVLLSSIPRPDESPPLVDLEREPQPEPAAAAEPEPELVAEPEPDALAETELEATPVTEAEPATESEPELAPEPARVTEAGVERQAESEREAETAAEAEAEAAPEAAPEQAAQPDLEAEPEAEAEPEPEPEAAAAPEPEAEAEPEETFAPDEAYMTYKGLSAVSVEEQPQGSTTAPEEDSGEDAYEDWTPKRG